MYFNPSNLHSILIFSVSCAKEVFPLKQQRDEVLVNKLTESGGAGGHGDLREVQLLTELISFSPSSSIIITDIMICILHGQWTLNKSKNSLRKFIVSYKFGWKSASHNLHEMYITQVPLQVHSGDKVLTTLETGKCYVPMLLLDVHFQGKPLSGLELTVITVDEEAHVLCLDVGVQSTFPPALEATELTGELHLEKR